MNIRKTVNLLILLLSASMWSCTGGGSAAGIEESLRQAEEAVTLGDMQVARSVADHMTGDEILSQLSAVQLARLSMVYMQLADNDNDGTSTATAVDLYNRAYKADADSAELFYTGVSPEQMQHVAAMSSLVSNLNHPVDMSDVDEFTPDSIIDNVMSPQ